jgi:hypothetical protein
MPVEFQDYSKYMKKTGEWPAIGHVFILFFESGTKL